MIIFDEKYRASCRFCDSDAFYILILLKGAKYLGLGVIADALGMKRTSVRSLVHMMADDELVDYGHRGASITELGRQILRATPVIPLDIEISFALGEFRQAVKVPGMADQITSGVHQVKLSNMVGATGCTTWVVENGMLLMPPLKEHDYPRHKEYERIIAEAGLRDGDVLLVCGADSKRAARAAALYVALDLY